MSVWFETIGESTVIVLAFLGLVWIILAMLATVHRRDR